MRKGILRPVGLPIHQSGWEDAQCAVRVIRSQTAKQGSGPTEDYLPPCGFPPDLR